VVPIPAYADIRCYIDGDEKDDAEEEAPHDNGIIELFQPEEGGVVKGGPVDIGAGGQGTGIHRVHPGMDYSIDNIRRNRENQFNLLEVMVWF